jgi:hypothetical protein
MVMTKDEALKMAIEELHNALKLLKRFTPQSTGDGSWTAWTVGLKDQLSDLQHTLYNNGFVEGINACKKALEQPAQKPLSDDEINELWKESCEDVRGLNLGFTTQQHYFAWLIEQAHGIGAKE